MCRNTPSVPRHVHKHSFLLLFATGDMYITGTHCHQYTITCAHHIYQHSFFLLYYHRCNQSHLLLVHIDHRRRLRQGQSYKMGSRQLVQLFSQLKTFHCWQSHDIHTRYIYIQHIRYKTRSTQQPEQIFSKFIWKPGSWFPSYSILLISVHS